MNISSAKIGARLESAARRIAPALVAVYVAGFMFGRWLHRLNDRLSCAYVALLGVAPAKPTAPPAKRQAAPKRKPAVIATVVDNPLTVDELISRYSQRQLMTMAGTKSKRSKRQLAERITALKN